MARGSRVQGFHFSEYGGLATTTSKVATEPSGFLKRGSFRVSPTSTWNWVRLCMNRFMRATPAVSATASCPYRRSVYPRPPWAFSRFADAMSMPPDPRAGSYTDSKPLGSKISTMSSTTSRGVKNWPARVPDPSENRLSRYSYAPPSTSCDMLPSCIFGTRSIARMTDASTSAGSTSSAVQVIDPNRRETLSGFAVSMACSEARTRWPRPDRVTVARIDDHEARRSPTVPR